MNHFSQLSDNGLNLQAIFSLDQLPESIQDNLASTCTDLTKYNQLILIGHGGKLLWASLKDADFDNNDPIDEFAVRNIHQFFSQHPNINYEIIYPSNKPVGLQKLGELAGWHHPSPFRVGVNQEWGSWFAYRAVVLANSNFPLTKKMTSASPCDSCSDKPCIIACPAHALDNGTFNFDKCVEYRKKPDSSCKDRCLARIGCPVQKQHQYSEEQIKYHYLLSMKTINEYY